MIGDGGCGMRDRMRGRAGDVMGGRGLVRRVWGGHFASRGLE